MKDRIPKYPGRVTLTPVEGQANTFDMIRADEPEQEGTPLNKATLLTDETASLFGLGEDATVDDTLSVLSGAALATSERVQTSRAGDQWDVADRIPSTLAWYGIAYGNGTWVAYQTNALWYSHDGLRWTKANVSFSYGDLTRQTVIFDGEQFVFINAGNKTHSSTFKSVDGVNWTQMTNNIGTPFVNNSSLYQIRYLTYQNGIYAAVMRATDDGADQYIYIVSSSDAINWTRTKLGSETTVGWLKLSAGNGVFVYSSVTTISDGRLAYSTDAKTWAKTGVILTSGKMCLVHHCNGVFISVEYQGSLAAYSEDGVSWTKFNLPKSAYWRSVIYCDGRYFFGSGSNALESYHTTNFTEWSVMSMLGKISAYEYLWATDGLKVVVMPYSANDQGCYTETAWENRLNFTDVKGNSLGDAIASMGAQIETGSYVGTGTYGVNNPTTLTFGFEPKMVVISANAANSSYDYSVTAVLSNGRCVVKSMGTDINVRISVLDVTISGNSISWYQPLSSITIKSGSSPSSAAVGPITQLNTSGSTYNYIAIG